MNEWKKGFVSGVAYAMTQYIKNNIEDAYNLFHESGISLEEIKNCVDDEDYKTIKDFIEG